MLMREVRIPRTAAYTCISAPYTKLVIVHDGRQIEVELPNGDHPILHTPEEPPLDVVQRVP